MRNKINKELLLQIAILAVCLLILKSAKSENFVKARTGCPGPPFYGETPGDGYFPGDQMKYSWAQNSPVIVKIDNEWNETERNQIKAGIEEWNGTVSIQTCSNVTFSDFGAQTFPDKDAFPPYPGPKMIYVMKDSRAFSAYFRPDVRGTPLRLVRAIINITSPADLASLKRYAAHETGHSFGLGNCNPCGTSSLMGTFNVNVTTPTFCDIDKIKQIYCPTPTPTPTPLPDGWEYCEPPYGEYNYCPTGTVYDNSTGLCCPGECPDPPPIYSCELMMMNELPEGMDTCPYYVERPCGATPVVLDILGNGFSLTDAADGVDFNLYNNPDGTRERFSWTAADSDDAWLVFDRNQNGLIDNGRELFGNFTPQSMPPAGEQRNGFLALGEYDKARQGGNSDGVIDAQDSIFHWLRLWRDANHNGVSEAGELFTLWELNVSAIELEYKESKKMDAHGNEFGYRAKVWDAKKSKINRWAWDVFLSVQPPQD